MSGYSNSSSHTRTKANQPLPGHAGIGEGLSMEMGWSLGGRRGQRQIGAIPDIVTSNCLWSPSQRRPMTARPSNPIPASSTSFPDSPSSPPR